MTDVQYHYKRHIACELCGRSTRGPLNEEGDVTCDSCHRVLLSPKGSESWKHTKIKELQETELLNKKRSKAQLEKEIRLLEEMLEHS